MNQQPPYPPNDPNDPSQPFYPPQQPYPPPPPPAPRRRIRPAYIIIPIVGILICCIGGIAVIANGNKPATSTPTTVAQVTTAPTPKPTATPTPSGPHPVFDATFGGREDDFIVKYGQPILSNNGVLFQFKFTTPDGKPGVVAIQLPDEKSSDGKQHVVTITLGPLNPNSTTWSTATAEAAAKLFLPKDATFLQDKQVPDLGLYHLYVSPNLGATFPADQFLGAVGNRVTPGTFWLTCGTNAAGGCTFQLGDIT